MLPGRFLGFARTTGDSFTFLILPDQSSRVIHRSVIQRRQHTIMNNTKAENTEVEDSTVEQENTEVEDNHTTEIEEEETEKENNMIEENHTTTIGNDHEDNDIILEDNNIMSTIQSTPTPAISNTTPVYNHFNNIQTDIEDILNLSFNPEDGTLQANIKWKDGQESIIPAVTLQIDDPVCLASFIERHPVERNRTGHWNNWSKTTLKDIRTITRCLRQKYIIENLSKNKYYHCRRTVRRRKTNSNQLCSYLGGEIPRTVQEALSMDVKNQDNKWKEAIEKEISSIQEHKTFEFLHSDAPPPEEYQCAPLQMIFDVKSDLRRKASLVVGGYKVDASNQNSYSSVVKLDSTR
jgi:hypothetical protein